LGWIDIYNLFYSKQNFHVLALEDQTPYEAWYGIKFGCEQLKKIGCLTYAHILKELHQKLEMKAHECIFLGYAETKGHE
jgi:hypothetical protein